MTVVFAFLLLAFLTSVHEAGHWIAIRLRGGRVMRLTLGRGGPVFRREGEPSFALGLLPIGGRIDYDGVPDGTGQAVVAVSGAVANLCAAGLLFLSGALLVGADLFPAGEGGGPFHFALEATATWFWIVPGALADLLVHQRVEGMGRAIWFLYDLLARGQWAGLLYLAGASSALWASLNLLPIPGLGTDGWHLVRSLAGTLKAGGTHD
jgi:hypothetical protein